MKSVLTNFSTEIFIIHRFMTTFTAKNLTKLPLIEGLCNTKPT